MAKFKPFNYCYLCKYILNIQIEELTGIEYKLNPQTNKYDVTDDDSKSLISYLSQFGINTNFRLLNDHSHLSQTDLSYYIYVFYIMQKHSYTLQQDCDNIVNKLAHDQQYLLFLDNIIVFSKNTLPISSFYLAKLYSICYWGIINTKLDLSPSDKCFSRIHPNFSTIFFNDNITQLLNFANDIAKIISFYSE